MDVTKEMSKMTTSEVVRSKVICAECLKRDPEGSGKWIKSLLDEDADQRGPHHDSPEAQVISIESEGLAP